MERSEIIKELKKYFSIKELVCNDVYKKFGDSAWRFFDDKILHILLILRRDIFKSPITINNGTTFTQRGLRCNMCALVKGKKSVYLSAHILGKAFDMDIKGFTAAQARTIIKQNIDKIPYSFRMEDGVNWLHIDVIDMGNGKKLTMFTD